MATGQEMVLRKRARDLKKVCTTYGLLDPPCRFFLDTCDDIEATIKDSKGLTVSILSLTTPNATISKKGNYNICIEGNGIGTLYTSCGESGGGGGEDCCDELREKYENLLIQINDLRTRIVNLENIIENLGEDCCEELRTEINNLKERVRILEQQGGGGGDGCCEELRNEITNINNRLTTIENNITNITNRLNNLTITGGTGISVTKQGDNYTIVNTSPNTDSVTTIVAGNNISVTDTGTGGNHVYTISSTGGGGGGLPSDFDIQGGTNVTVTKNGNVYIISSRDTDTKPVLVQPLTVTCDIGGIPANTTYMVGTSLEAILRDLLNCGSTPPQPTNNYPWFTSHVVNRTGWVEEWDEFDVDPEAGTHTFNVAQTFEECPVKFDIPAILAPLTLELYNEIFARWEVNTRDFAITNITRTIDGQSVDYLRYTDAREVTGATRPVRMTWNP